MVAVGHMDPLQKECIVRYFLLSDENYKRPLQKLIKPNKDHFLALHFGCFAPNLIGFFPLGMRAQNPNFLFSAFFSFFH